MGRRSKELLHTMEKREKINLAVDIDILLVAHYAILHLKMSYISALNGAPFEVKTIRDGKKIARS